MRHALMIAAVLLWAGGCVDSRFLRGAACGDDRDCGRSLSCTQGVCGGCPEGIPLVDGRCGCPGDRVLDCRVLPPDAACMPVCPSATELCEVVEDPADGGQSIPSCDNADVGVRCFAVELPSPDCPEGEAKIHLVPSDPDTTLIVNCPPPETEDSHFDCVDEDSP